MLANTLNTNEVKNRAGTEVEFSRILTNERKTVFAQVAETPSLKHRITIQHSESGVGAKTVRRSNIRIDKDVLSAVDASTVVTYTSSLTLTFPVGHASTSNDAKDVLAELISFCASLGASTTILYDGTGNGSVALLEGGL